MYPIYLNFAKPFNLLLHWPLVNREAEFYLKLYSKEKMEPSRRQQQLLLTVILVFRGNILKDS